MIFPKCHERWARGESVTLKCLHLLTVFSDISWRCDCAPVYLLKMGSDQRHSFLGFTPEVGVKKFSVREAVEMVVRAILVSLKADIPRKDNESHTSKSHWKLANEQLNGTSVTTAFFTYACDFPTSFGKGNSKNGTWK